MHSISVIIVSYNVRHFLIQCLQSLFEADQANIELEVFVVDNNSIDHSAKAVEHTFPSVRLIRNSTNIGFGRANNQAIALSKSDYILLLNPDTIVQHDTLTKCVEFIKHNPAYGAVGVKMVDGNGKYLQESKRSLPSPLSAFFKITRLNSIFPRSTFMNSYYTKELSGEKDEDVEVLCGAFMFCNATVLKKLKGFDEAFFMYGEDIDLSKRILEDGYKIKYLAETSIIHFKGESSKKASFNYLKSFYQSMIIYVDKHYRGSGAFLTKIGLKIAIVLSAITRSFKEVIQASYKPILDFIVIFLGLQVLKTIWSIYYYNDPEYYTQAFLWNSFSYATLWVGSLYYWGWYDSHRRVKSLLLGSAFGTLLILILYALLPLQLRSSRALLLIGSVLSICLPLITNWTIGALSRLMSGHAVENNILVIGSEQSKKEIESTLDEDMAKRIVLTIDPHQPYKDTPGILHLEELVKIYEIHSIIFASKDLESAEIIDFMKRLGDKIDYKIADVTAQQIIGSNSNSKKGKIYNTYSNYNLSKAVYNRLKRTIDILIALLFLIGSPILFFFHSYKKMFHGKIIKLLLGRLTVVSYNVDKIGSNHHLPHIKKGIIVLHESYAPKDYPMYLKVELNDWYAKNYTPFLDLEILKNALTHDEH